MDSAVVGQMITGVTAIVVALVGLQTARAAAARSIVTEKKMDIVAERTDGALLELKNARESKGYAEGLAEGQARAQAVLDRAAALVAVQKAAGDAARLEVLGQPTAPQVAASANDAARVLSEKVTNGAAVVAAAHDAAMPAEVHEDIVTATQDLAAATTAASEATERAAASLEPAQPVMPPAEDA